MPLDQRRVRMRVTRTMVSENNVYFWAARMLLTAARLRKRACIQAQIDAVARPFGLGGGGRRADEGTTTYHDGPPGLA